MKTSILFTESGRYEVNSGNAKELRTKINEAIAYFEKRNICVYAVQYLNEFGKRNFSSEDEELHAENGFIKYL